MDIWEGIKATRNGLGLGSVIVFFLQSGWLSGKGSVSAVYYQELESKGGSADSSMESEKKDDHAADDNNRSKGERMADIPIDAS